MWDITHFNYPIQLHCTGLAGLPCLQQPFSQTYFQCKQLNSPYKILPALRHSHSCSEVRGSNHWRRHDTRDREPQYVKYFLDIWQKEWPGSTLERCMINWELCCLMPGAVMCPHSASCDGTEKRIKGNILHFKLSLISHNIASCKGWNFTERTKRASHNIV